MLLGEAHRRPHIHQQLILPWPPEPTSPSTPTVATTTTTSNYAAMLSSLRRNLFSYASPAAEENSGELDYFPAEHDDDFFMYEFKVRNCTQARAHDWTECPFAHPGEKARRRDPRKHNYSGNSCSEFRKGNCKKGDKCEFAHGVFESWLHPSKFRTQACKDGPGCTRRVCFFAHSPDQLRSRSGADLNANPDSEFLFPEDHVQRGVGDLVKALRSLHLNKAKSLPSSWPGIHVASPMSGSPPLGKSALGRAGFFSLPATPTQPAGGGILWDKDQEEEVVMERVESGREVRARMFEKLSKENSFNRSGSGSDPVVGSGPGPDVGCVSDLIISRVSE